jgi:hypothetical protein
MRSILKTSTSILLAAVLATSALSASPASATNFIHGGAGGFHGGGFHGRGFHGNRFGGGGWGGAALGIGVAGLAVGLMASQSCSGVQNVYDAYGNYVGQRAVNNC